jgi:hypothetical protein
LPGMLPRKKACSNGLIWRIDPVLFKVYGFTSWAGY